MIWPLQESPKGLLPGLFTFPQHCPSTSSVHPPQQGDAETQISSKLEAKKKQQVKKEQPLAKHGRTEQRKDTSWENSGRTCSV